MKKISSFNKTMIILIYTLLGIIIAGTIFSGIKRINSDGENKNTNQPVTLTPVPENTELQSLNKKSEKKISTYTGLGTIRAVTKIEEDEDFGTAIVMTPWFSYTEDDSAFFEELSRKRVPIIGIITNYFSSKTYSQLQKINEEKIKADLLNLINNQLSLGKISQIYFTDFIFLN